jgi:YHS domain-containing protein
MCHPQDDAPSHVDAEPADACHAHTAPRVGSVPDDDVAECPVMPGSTTVKAHAEAAGLVRDHEGVRYWLCCSSCGPRFDADPARYARAS